MFGSQQRGIQQYENIGLETGVSAANPNKLIVMLYDGAISACHLAARAIQSKDIEVRSQSISKAIMIIESGLRLSLDKKAGGQIALSLDALYAYISNQLYLANIKNSVDPIQEVIRLMSELREAWEEINQQNLSTQPSLTTPEARLNTSYAKD